MYSSNFDASVDDDGYELQTSNEGTKPMSTSKVIVLCSKIDPRIFGF